MQKSWTKQALTRRIDRCYLVAARTKIARKREQYIALARGYRTVLSGAHSSGWHLHDA